MRRCFVATRLSDVCLIGEIYVLEKGVDFTGHPKFLINTRRTKAKKAGVEVKLAVVATCNVAVQALNEESGSACRAKKAKGLAKVTRSKNIFDEILLKGHDEISNHRQTSRDSSRPVHLLDPPRRFKC